MYIEFGLDVEVSLHPLAIQYGADMFGPEPELRSLDAIRPSLRQPDCDGPDPVYAIVMDVGRPQDREELLNRDLLFGVVAYAAGRLGNEPVRSQGHVHKVSRHSGWAAPEIFEIWDGRGLVYMQESVTDDPGRCIAIEAQPGDRVIVPPGWGHAVISADPERPLVFGAWCDRDYGFQYGAVLAHGGLAWFPVLEENAIRWESNPRYRAGRLETRGAREYPEMGLDAETPLYEQARRKPAGVQWVSRPALVEKVWAVFEP